MKIANIFPIRNQNFYREEDVTMVLAHLVEKNLYNPKNFQKNALVMMDNGLYEGEQVSTDLLHCIALAENSKINITEIVVPDAINDLDKTIELFEENLQAIRDWNDQYTFMFVAQAKKYEDFDRAIEYINQYHDLKLSVGISKLTPLDRADNRAIEAYKKCNFPIHFLGIKKSFTELDKVHNLIRSCDTSQLCSIVKETDITPNVWSYVRKGENVDLEKDWCRPHRLLTARDKLYMEKRNNGIL